MLAMSVCNCLHTNGCLAVANRVYMRHNFYELSVHKVRTVNFPFQFSFFFIFFFFLSLILFATLLRRHSAAQLSYGSTCLSVRPSVIELCCKLNEL